MLPGEKVDEAVLALLWLTTFQDTDGKHAWKGHDWEVLKRLHGEDYIGNPTGKAKSVTLTEEGARRSEDLFRRLFSS